MQATRSSVQRRDIALASTKVTGSGAKGHCPCEAVFKKVLFSKEALPSSEKVDWDGWWTVGSVPVLRRGIALADSDAKGHCPCGRRGHGVGRARWRGGYLGREHEVAELAELAAVAALF